MNTIKRALSMLLIVAMLLSCFPAVVFAAETAGETYIQDLEVDQRTTPLGIDNLTPEFRWEMVSDVRGQEQTAYQIVVKNGEKTVWDSGKVTSGISNAIRYDGSDLESSTRYTWTVTVWDKDGTALESQSSWFEMGLLNESDWDGADFIAPTMEGVVDPLATDQYTIDFDFIIVEDNMGFCFNMSDTANFIMWQINTVDGGGSVLLRPHFQAGGSWKGYPGQAGYNVKAIDITNAVGVSTASELVGKEVHQRLVVSGANIKTYFGPAGTTAATPTTELTLADDFTYSGASSLPFRGIGFRHCSDNNAQETAKYDNFVAVCNKTGEVLYTNDFSDGKIPFSGNHLAIEDGWLKVGTTATTGGEMKAVATKPTAGSSAPMFRKEFPVKEGLVSARLYATSLGIYEAYINGEKAGVDKMAPGWTDYKKYVQYQTYDITDMLVEGTNAIGAIVGNGWYSGHVSNSGLNHYGTDEAFIGQILLTYADGTTETIGTDATWQAYLDGPFVATDNQDGETYDANKEVPGWNTPGFNTSNWINTKIATSSTINTEVKPESVALVAQPEEPVQEIEYLKPTFLAKTAEDTYVYDLGQNISGVIRINVKGEAGTTMKLRFGEMVYKDTNALYTANLRTAKVTDYYTLKGDENGETYQPTFTFHGFRYFEVSGLGYQPDVEDIVGVVIHSKLDRTGYVETNNELVNQLFSNIIWGHRDNYLSIPTDCPQRDERMGWTGDASVFSRTASMNFDINAFYTKYIRDVYAASSNGNMPSIAPIEPHPSFVQGASVWGDFAVIGPWTMFTTYGDTAILEEAWPYMTGWINYYETTKAGSDYLCNFDTYGDWLAISESTDSLYSSSCFYAYVTGLMVKMANVLGKTEEAAYYAALEQNIKNAIVNKYVNKTTGVISSNSQTAYVLALAFDILPEGELRQKAADNLVARIEAMDWHLSGGFIGIENLLPVLTKYGYNDVAYQLLLTETYPSWLYPVVNGATTMWERWNSYIAETGTFGDVSMNSFNHYSFGAVGAWMYQYAGGIQFNETEGSYKNFTIAPNPNNQLDEFKVSYESVYGEIVSDWTLKNGKFSLNVKVPANTTATLVVPSDVELDLAIDNVKVTSRAAVDGVEYLGTENGKAYFKVESGSYDVDSTVLERYAVTASAPVVGGTFTNVTVNGAAGRAVVASGEEVTVEATAVNDAEWEFVSWTGDMESTENPLTFKAEDNTELIGTFRYVGKDNLAVGASITSKTNAGSAPGFYHGGLVDGLYITANGANGWTSGGNASADANEWLQFDLGAVTPIDEVHLYPRTDILAADGNSCSFPVDYTIQVSEDGTEWKTVVTEVGHAAPAQGEPVFHTFDSVNARYVKLDVTKLGAQPVGDANYRVQLAEFGIYNSTVADEYTLVINGNGKALVNGEEVELPYTKAYEPNTEVVVEPVSTATSIFSKWTGSVNSTVAEQSLVMNANKTLNVVYATPADTNLALGKLVTGNNPLSSGSAWGPQLLTDGKFPGTGYSNNDTSAVREGANEVDFWLTIDLGETKLLDTITLYPRNTPAETAAGKTPSYPNTFTFQVSDNNADWTIVKSVADERTPGAGEAMTYDFAPVAGRYVKLHVTKAGLVEDSDKYYRLQLQEEEIYNTNYVETVSFVNEAVLDEGTEITAVLEGTTVKGDVLDLDAFKPTYVSSNDAVATVNEEGVITGVAAGEAVITGTVVVNGVTYTAEQTVTVNSVITDVTMIVTGEPEVTLETEELTFTVSAANTVKLVTASITMEFDTTTMGTPEVAPVGNWFVIGQAFQNGKLIVVLGNNEGSTSEAADPMMTITVPTTGETGSATVKITNAKLSAYEGEGETYVTAILGEEASVTTEIKYSVYDVNRDGIVDQLDLTRMQRFFGSDDPICDVNGVDGVNIDDMVLVLMNYTVPEF